MRKLAITFYLIIICCSLQLVAVAQNGYEFKQYDLGLALAFNTPYAQSGTVTNSNAGIFSLTFNSTPYVNHMFEAQLGGFRGTDIYGNRYNNQYKALDYRAQFQLGEVINYDRSPFKNALKNLYASAGVGMMFNSLKNFYNAGFYPGNDLSRSRVFVPLKVGYEAKLFSDYNKPFIKLDVGYQYDVTFGDVFGGYNVPYHINGVSQFIIGVKLAVGGYDWYKKPISYD